MMTMKTMRSLVDLDQVDCDGRLVNLWVNQPWIWLVKNMSLITYCCLLGTSLQYSTVNCFSTVLSMTEYELTDNLTVSL